MFVKPIPDGYNVVTPYLIVADAQRLIDFLASVFGAQVKEQLRRPDGKIAHTELTIGSSMIMLSESSEHFPPNDSMLHIYVPDVDASYQLALASGAAPLSPPADQFYGDRTAGVAEPCGNKIWLATHIEDVPHEELAARMRARG